MVIGAANQIRLDDEFISILAEWMDRESPDWNEYGTRRSPVDRLQSVAATTGGDG